MQEYTTEEKTETKVEQAKKWLQDNLRIIVSIVIVAVIAGGIYSYSKRVESPTISEEAATEQSNPEDSSVEVADQDEQAKSAEEKVAQKTEVAAPQASSKETESAFVESAGRGDGTTRLARRALANYLEKNPDSALTKEHKIYIEDYLRKNISTKKVSVGTSVEFSKDLIQKAVEKSKSLNEKQLKNLEKYSARVSSL